MSGSRPEAEGTEVQAEIALLEARFAAPFRSGWGIAAQPWQP